MIILLFLSMLAFSLMFGAWLATRWARAGLELTSGLLDEMRGIDICNEAENGWAR